MGQRDAMMRDLSETDFGDILCLEWVEKLAQLIRRELNLWVGFVGRDGRHQWVGGEVVDKPLCEMFLLKNEEPTCFASYRGWLDEASSVSMPLFMECHAGLRGVIAPVRAWGECLGGFFASGFLFGDDERSEGEILDYGVSLQFNRKTLAHGCHEIVRLTRREGRMLRGMLAEMAREAESWLARKASEAHEDGAEEDAHDFGAFIGRSQPIQDMLRAVEGACDAECTVLLVGKPGVGKALVARMIHHNSARRTAAFLSLNCAMPEASALDSELFGHRRGAAANAFADKPGLLDVAHKGTFYLEDIDALAMPLQLKLVHYLKTGSFYPLGDVEAHEVDVRIVASTSVDLGELVKRGTFRQDLYDMLGAVEIDIPELRNHAADIPALCAHFLVRKCAENRRPCKAMTEGALEWFMRYSWPGNVRELENEIARLVVVSGNEREISQELIAMRIQNEIQREEDERRRQEDADLVVSADVAEHARSQKEDTSLPPLETGLARLMEESERRFILAALARNHDNRTKTAEMLKISRRNLIRKIEQLGITGRPENDPV